MTILQLKVALGICELGSISGAAARLEISQPNASSYLKALESEVGFAIFNRSKSGVVVTEKGRIFLKHAQRMIFEQNEIMDIQAHSDMYRLRVGSVNGLLAAEPFLKLAEAHRDDPETVFRYYNVSVEEGIENLDKYELDILFLPAKKAQLAGLSDACKKHSLSMISLGEKPAVLSVRKGHPAISEGRCFNITQGSDAMKDYPYVAYRNLSSDSGATGYNDTAFVQSKYVIYVDEISVRLRLVSSTDAFIFGIVHSKEVNEQYGLVSFPVPGVSLEIFCLIRSADRDRREIKDYLSLLQQELNMAKE